MRVVKVGRELSALRARFLELRGRPTRASDVRSLRRTVSRLEQRAAEGEDVAKRPARGARARPFSASDRQWAAVLELARVLEEPSASAVIRLALRRLAADVDKAIAKDLED